MRHVGPVVRGHTPAVTPLATKGTQSADRSVRVPTGHGVAGARGAHCHLLS
jgi:hypothetical protein